MNSFQKVLWIKELQDRHSNEDIAIMLNIDKEDVDSILAGLNGGQSVSKENISETTPPVIITDTIGSMPVHDDITIENKDAISTVTESKEEVAATEPIQEPKKPKQNNRDIVKKLYLEDKKSYNEISEELGIAISTVKLYVSQGGYCRNPRHKRRRKKSEIVDDNSDDGQCNKQAIKNDKTYDHTYENIGGGFYMRDDGVLFRKMSKREFVEAMLDHHNKIKNK